MAVEQLVERNRVSKRFEGYTQSTQNIALLKRAREKDVAVHPGQDIEYVVVDDEKTSRERVALAHEEIKSYDALYYETQLFRGIEVCCYQHSDSPGVGLLVNYDPYEVEPPHPVCDMKLERLRDGVIGKRDPETSETTIITGKRSQRQQYQDRLFPREIFI
ncbi:hypothetical protein JCM17823_06250 [Halorubrum gandharaense]